MQILRFPDARLFVKCQPVTIFGEELIVILEGMFETMVKSSGIGLAANQVGLTYHMFTMIGPEEEKLFIINPTIKSKSAAPANLREGCLSAPGEFLVRPDRAQWVQVEFKDASGTTVTRVFKGLHAVCVEHEMEHLDGKGFMQSKALPKAKRQELSRKWKV